MPAGISTMSLQGTDLQVVRRGSGRPIVWLHGRDGVGSICRSLPA